MYLAYNVFGSRAEKEEFVESSEKPKLKFLNFMGESCQLFMPFDSPLLQQHAIGFDLDKNVFINSPFVQYNSEGPPECQKFNFDEHSSRQSLLDESLLNHTENNSIFKNKNYKFQLKIDNHEPIKLSMKYEGSYTIQLKDHPSPDAGSPNGYV